MSERIRNMQWDNGLKKVRFKCVKVVEQETEHDTRAVLRSTGEFPATLSVFGENARQFRAGWVYEVQITPVGKE